MPLRALVVARAAALLSVLHAALAESAIEGEACSELDVARECLERRRYDAIAVDLAMAPGSDLLLDLRKTRYNRTSTVIAIVDAEPLPREVLESGGIFTLRKPVGFENARELVKQAERVMRQQARRHRRYPATFPVYVSCDNVFDRQAKALDLSESGMALQLPGTPLEQYIWLRFALPDTADKLRVQARVTWQEANGRTGVGFVDLPDTARRQLQHWAALQTSSLRRRD